MKNTRGLSAKNIDSYNSRAAMFREKMRLKEENEDTHIRTEIQAVISRGIQEGKNKEEIIELLSQNDRLLKYEMFFESWTQHQIDKANIQKEKNSNKEKDYDE